MLTINQKRQATSGEVRVASRTTLSSDPWSYYNLDSTGSYTPMTGYDVSLAKTLGGIQATWLISSPSTVPNPNRIRWSLVQPVASQSVATTELYGAPSKFLNTNGSSIAFNCAERLCVIDSARAIPTIRLVSAEPNKDGIDSAWVVLNRVPYLVASSKGQLSMFRP